MTTIVNPSAPEYNPDHWNDFSWMGLSFFIAEQHPEIQAGLEHINVKVTPNNIASVLKNYSDGEIAIALKVDREEAAEFRETVETLVQARQLSTNCFCHAANDDGPFPPFMKPWPGMLQGLKPSDGDVFEADRLIDVTEASGATAVGMKPVEKDGFYNVALLLRKDSKELHYVRENSNGEYSHKTALGPVTNLDESGNVVTDPTNADWGDYELKQIFLFPEGGLTVGIPVEQRAERSPELDKLFEDLSF